MCIRLWHNRCVMKTLQCTVLVRDNTPTELLNDKEKYPFFRRGMVVYRVMSHYRSVMVGVEILREEQRPNYKVKVLVYSCCGRYEDSHRVQKLLQCLNVALKP